MSRVEVGVEVGVGVLAMDNNKKKINGLGNSN